MKPQAVARTERAWCLIMPVRHQRKKQPAFERWYLASLTMFGTRSEAILFAVNSGFEQPYKAVRITLAPDFGVTLR